jgi:hydrogenase 3 maturation protease
MDVKTAKSRISNFFAKFSKKVRANKKFNEDEKYRKSISEIFRSLEIKKQRYAILGLGNDLKGDDGVGWYIIDKLSKEFGKDENLLLIKTSVPENHVREIKDFAPHLLIIIDAADFKEKPGTIKYISEYNISHSLISTHTTPLTLFLHLYQSDQPVKKDVIIIGIQRKSNEFGQPLSRPVKRAGNILVDLIASLYKRNMLSSLQEELENLTNPLKRIMKRKKKVIGF